MFCLSPLNWYWLQLGHGGQIPQSHRQKDSRRNGTKQEKIFIEGCQKHGGLSLKKAEELWQLFDPFKGYGFNKAHAASYAKVAYQTAYMKANYPTEFMAAVLTTDSGEVEKIAETIGECVRMKLPVLPPDVNESLGDFTVVSVKDKDKETEGIRFGLYTIKNLGKEIANAIIEERLPTTDINLFPTFLTASSTKT